MIDNRTRKLWQPNGGKTILRRRGTEYSLRRRTSLIPKPWGMKQLTRWHLYHESAEIAEVMPYRDMDTAIEQAEAWIADAETAAQGKKLPKEKGRMAQR